MLIAVYVWSLVTASSVTASSLSPDKPQNNALLQTGRTAIESGHPESAATAFRAALEKMSAGHASPDSMFAMRIALATAYLASGELRLAEQSLREAGPSPINHLSAAVLANTWGGLYLQQGRYEQARTKFAGGLNRISGSADGGRLRSVLLDNLAAAELHLGLYPDAFAHQQAALTIWQVASPPEPAKLVEARAGLASIQFFSGDAAAAYTTMLVALESARQSFGARNPVMANLLESQAVILKRLGRKREARNALAEARRIRPTAGVMNSTVDVRTLTLNLNRDSR